MENRALTTLKCLTLFCFIVLSLFEASAQAPANDNIANAIDIGPISGTYSSMDAEFTTVDATGDEVKPTAWSGGPHTNVWFKFVADTTVMSVEVETGGVRGTLKYPRVALYDSLGSVVYALEYVGQLVNVGFSYTNLTANNTYYIAVESASPSWVNQGTFSLTVRDHATNDHRLNAINIPIQSGPFDSPDNAYTTVIGSPDHTRPANWSSDPISNVWFKFQATSTGQAAIKVRTGSNEGTLQFARLALYDSIWQHVQSVEYVGQNDDVGMSVDGLVDGSEYYISVDLTSSQSYRKGSFALSVSPNATHDLKAAAHSIDISSGMHDYVDAEFTTAIATADHTKPQSWAADVYSNVWFKIQAPADSAITVTVKTGGAAGTLQFPRLALFDSDANGTHIKSVDYISQYGELGLTAKGLTPGRDYFISVDGASPQSFRRGSFSLKIVNQAFNDYFTDAIELPLTSGSYLSTPKAYDNNIASGDGLQPANWTDPAYANVWFKFQALTTEMSVKVMTGDTLGTLKFPRVALFNADGSQSLESTGYFSEYGHVGFSVDTLSVGQDYYISVDASSNIHSQRGSFTLEVNSVGTNDLFYRAEEIQLVDSSYCSTEAAFTTGLASSGHYWPANWLHESITDVWHKFTAPVDGNADITVKVGGSEGTMEFPRLAVYNESRQEVASINYAGQYDDVTLLVTGLKADSVYYIGTDVSSTQLYRRGTFSLCVEYRPAPSCETELWAIASGDWNNPNTWSLTEGGPPVNAVPCNLTKVNIKGYTVTVNSVETATALSLNIDGTGIASKLMLQSGILQVQQEISITGSNSVFEKTDGSTIEVTGQQSNSQ